MTRRKHANNVTTTITTTINAAATSIIVTSATGMPTLSASEVFYGTLQYNNQIEIVIVTARSGTTLTVTRAAEGTTAQVFPAGSLFEIRDTANSYDRKADLVATAGDVVNFGDATSLEIPNNATATLSNAGEIALDTSVTDFADGVLCYRAGSTDYGVIAIPKSDLASPINNYVVTYDSTTDKFKLAAGGGGGGSGDVVGPSSATDNAVARYDSTTGKLIQNSGVLISDDNNVVANNLAPGYTTTATAGGTTTLTVASTGIQYFTGSTTQTITLPVTSTLTTGHAYLILNNSTGNLTVNSSGNNNVVTISQGMYAIVQCILTSGTTAASWEYYGTAGPSVSSTQLTDRFLLFDASNNYRLSYITPGNINQVGTIGTGTWQGNTIAYNYGGTGLTSVVQGDLIYGSSSSAWSKLAKDTNATRYLSNQGTSNNPSWNQVNLANGVTSVLPLANGGTGANLVDPNVDRILFWDDSAGTVGFLEAGSGLSISGTTMTSSGGSGVTDGDKGDITVASSGTVWTIDTPGSVTLATNDKILLKDTSASDAMGYATAQAIRDIAPSAGTTGTGSEVNATSPTLVTPILGVASATSINFGQDALNYYDEGTFTPTFTFVTAGDLSVSYATQSGNYTRIGRVVYLNIAVICTPTYTTASGNIRIGGLPFTPSSAQHFCQMTHTNTLSYPAGRTWVAGFSNTDSTVGVLSYGSSQNQTQLNTSNAASGVQQSLQFSFFYIV